MKRGIRLVWAAGALVAAPLAAQHPVSAIRTYRDAHQGAILAGLRDFLSLQSVAGNLPNIRRNAEALVAMLEKRAPGRRSRIPARSRWSSARSAIPPSRPSSSISTTTASR